MSQKQTRDYTLRQLIISSKRQRMVNLCTTLLSRKTALPVQVVSISSQWKFSCTSLGATSIHSPAFLFQSFQYSLRRAELLHSLHCNLPERSTASKRNKTLKFRRLCHYPSRNVGVLVRIDTGDTQTRLTCILFPREDNMYILIQLLLCLIDVKEFPMNVLRASVFRKTQ
jgi:hypothetical protein